jgi:hypothetical protein
MTRCRLVERASQCVPIIIRRLPNLAQMRSADRIDLCLSLEAKRETFTRDEYFAF